MHTHQLSQKACLWVLLTLVLAVLPSLFNLPLWIFVPILLSIGLRYARHRVIDQLAWAVKIAGLLIIVAGIWFSFESWFSGEAVLAFFVGVVFLKWSEAKIRREYFLLIFSAVILAAVGALYWQNLLSLLHMFVVVLSLTIALLTINDVSGALANNMLLRHAGTTMLLGLPVMILLFLLFPRIQGPLWDVGLAFGLPVKAMLEKGDRQIGKMKVLEQGGILRISQDEGNVLVAEFEGLVPAMNRLYWRGQVFWGFDGSSWRLPTNWDNRARLLKHSIRNKEQFDAQLRWKKDPVYYTLRVMPNGGRWLYALDLVATGGPEVFISDEYQLLSIRRITHHEPKLKMLSYLDYGIGTVLSKQQQVLGLQWSEQSNPRLLAFGRALATNYSKPEDILYQLMKHLATGAYQFDPAYQITTNIAADRDQLDVFFFDQKRGSAEHLAGSVAMALRAAGIPSRLVMGYRGGTPLALTNFVIVKQAHAHVWVEAWFDDKGWVRVEAKDVVLAPDRQKKTTAKVVTESAVLTRNSVARKNAPAQASDADHADTGSQSVSAWQFPDIHKLFAGLEKWVIDYNPDRQIELLNQAGVKQSNWLDLLLALAISLLTIMALYRGVFWWLRRAHIDPVMRAYNQFCQRLASMECERKRTECPRDYLARAVRQHPEIEQELTEITHHYLCIRYGDKTSDDMIRLFQHQVKRFVSRF